MRGQEITFTQFEQEIKDDNVTEVVINQNKAVPTGVVTLTLRDSRETGRVNVSDVNETQKLLDKNDVEYRISAIPQDSAKKAVGAGPKSSVMAVMLAMAFGVAPRPKPQTPLVMTAAS